jgi:hypothetical protein
MRIGQAHIASGQVSATPVIPEVEPLSLDPAIRANLAKWLADSPSLKNLNTVIATPGSSSVFANALKTPKTTFAPSVLASLGIDLNRPLILSRQALASPVPVGASSSGKPKAKFRPQQVGPGLWAHPLPISNRALENVGHVVALGQIGLEPISAMGVHSRYVEGAGIVFDTAAVVVAVGELYQQVVTPREMTPLKKCLFYLKHAFSILTLTTHWVPVPGSEGLKLVGVIVKSCDKACDEVYAMQVKEAAAGAGA